MYTIVEKKINKIKNFEKIFFQKAKKKNLSKRKINLKVWAIFLKKK